MPVNLQIYFEKAIGKEEATEYKCAVTKGTDNTAKRILREEVKSEIDKIRNEFATKYRRLSLWQKFSEF